jgi:hypothetical protein
MPENPFIPPLNLPGPGARLRYAGQSAGSPMVDSGPVITQPPHVVVEQNRFVEPNAVVVTDGAFYGLLDVSGDTYLQGGTVTAGDGTITVPSIKVVDGDTGPEGTADHHLYLECTGDGVVEDDVLVPGWNISAVVDPPVSGATVPDNTLPTAVSSTGKKVYISLGVFTSTGFAPARVGNIQISFCPGNYTVSRS